MTTSWPQIGNAMPWGDAANPIKHAFSLDGFKYYYDSRTGVYHAVKPGFINGREILYYTHHAAQKHAAFSVDKDFNFVKPIGPPGLEVRLLAMKQAIEVHQVMES